MKRPRQLSSLILLATVLLLASCEAPQHQRMAVFNEADFAATRGTGTGSVVGQAYVVMKNNSIHYVQNTSVDINAVNAYTTEIIQRNFLHGENLTPPDPRYHQYARTAPTDATGHFAFHNLPPGDYYVASSADWKDWNWNTDNEGGMYKVWIQRAAPIYARVTVKSGQTTQVTDWTYGKVQSQ